MNTPMRTELMPGVWLTAIQTRKFKSSYWSLQLLTPLRQETASMAALLPRVLRRGTAQYPDQESLGAALDELYGGVIEPYVCKVGEVQCTGFAATFLDDSLTLDGTPIFRPAAELLGDLLLRPAGKNGRLRPDYVQSERQNLIADLKSLSNDKRTYSALKLVQEMCQEEPYGVSRLGTEETTAKITVSRLDKYYRQLLRESRVELYYCGSASSDQICQAWIEALMGLARQGSQSLPETALLHHPEAVRTVTEEMDVTQAKLALGFRANTGLNDAGYPAMMVANVLFGGGPISKLFQNVREKKSLCYYASSALEKHKGLICVQSGVDFSKVEEAHDEILAQLKALQEGSFSDEEMTAAKRLLLNQLTSCQDGQGSLQAYYQDYILSPRLVTPAELSREVSAVTREDVIAAAQRMELDTVYLLTGKRGED